MIYNLMVEFALLLLIGDVTTPVMNICAKQLIGSMLVGNYEREK